MRGLLVFDIDGTLLADSRALQEEVVVLLDRLHRSGWNLAFATGRSFRWALQPLAPLTMPYLLAPQNGALIVRMPEREVLASRYVERPLFSTMDRICCDEPSDYVLFSGFEHDDLVYYRPHRFCPDLLRFVLRRAKMLEETWCSVEEFSSAPIDRAASLKCFGREDSLQRVSRAVELELGLHCPVIRDPCSEGSYVAQATHGEANKGEAVQTIRRLLDVEGPVVAAGDDVNDRPMLEVADYRIVMQSAPGSLRALADEVAPPASEMGIVVGLERLLRRIGDGSSGDRIRGS